MEGYPMQFLLSAPFKIASVQNVFSLFPVLHYPNAWNAKMLSASYQKRQRPPLIAYWGGGGGQMESPILFSAPPPPPLFFRSAAAV